MIPIIKFCNKDLPTPRRLSGRIFGDSPATDKNSVCIRGTPEGSVAFLFPENERQREA
jgi:hypothetical protein